MGIEARRFHPDSPRLARLMAALHNFDIDLVIDIPANESQFYRGLRAGGYSDRIVSFEPLTNAHHRLFRSSKNDAAWSVHSRCALTDRSGEIGLNISGNSVSGSIIPMFAVHSVAAPDSIYQASKSVHLITPDSVASLYLEGAHAPLLKINTQGYEWPVLDGASAILPKVRGILMELPPVPFYDGQPLWGECIERPETEGFALWALEPVFIDTETGRTLQLDESSF